MKKKILVLIITVILMNLGQSCHPEHRRIVDISFNAAKIKSDNYDRQQIVYACTSSVKDKLVFVVSYKTEYLYGIRSFGNVCYATTVRTIIDNDLLHDTFSITFNKPFSYYGSVIPEMTNIFEKESIVKEIDKYESYRTFCGMSADIVLDFSDAFFKNAIFDPAEEYEVTFSCTTLDSIFFEKSIIVTFEQAIL